MNKSQFLENLRKRSSRWRGLLEQRLWGENKLGKLGAKKTIPGSQVKMIDEIRVSCGPWSGVLEGKLFRDLEIGG